jgi:hypothetical protein
MQVSLLSRLSRNAFLFREKPVAWARLRYGLRVGIETSPGQWVWQPVLWSSGLRYLQVRRSRGGIRLRHHFPCQLSGGLVRVSCVAVCVRRG